jgi:hypothetical protein
MHGANKLLGFRRLGGILPGLLRQNEGRLARPQKLQLFTDLQFLFRRTVLQLLDTITAVIVLPLQTGVLLFEPAYFAPFIHKRWNALRTPQREVAIDAYQYKNGQDSNATDEMMHSQRL